MSEFLAHSMSKNQSLEKLIERRSAVFMAARQADKEYDGPHPNSRGMTRAEYVGRAVLAELHAE